jgi:hypothetical protein
MVSGPSVIVCPSCHLSICGAQVGFPLIFSSMVVHIEEGHGIRGRIASRIAHLVAEHAFFDRPAGELPPLLRAILKEDDDISFPLPSLS